MRKDNALRMFSFCMDVFRFYVLVFLVVYTAWLTQSGVIQPLGSLFNFL